MPAPTLGTLPWRPALDHLDLLAPVTADAVRSADAAWAADCHVASIADDLLPWPAFVLPVLAYVLLLAVCGYSGRGSGWRPAAGLVAVGVPIAVLAAAATFGIVRQQTPAALNNVAFIALHIAVLSRGIAPALLPALNKPAERPHAEPIQQRAA